MELSEAPVQPITSEITEKTPAVAPEAQGPRLVDIEVTDQNVALNVLVSFVNVAQRRGVFALDESAKIWECVKSFTIEQPPASA